MDRSSAAAHPHRVFISSTKFDLERHRALAHDSILALGQLPDDMAQFYARPGTAISESVQAVQNDDIYVGIFAWRYGTIMPGEMRSITHWEYDEAVRLGLPRLIFLADPATELLDNPLDLFPADTRDTAHDVQRKALRAQLEQEQVVAYFTTPDDVGRKVAISLARLLYGHVPDWLQMPRDLPPPAPGFVGRESELQQVRQALQRERAVGISAVVAGMGGVGKSALAAEVLHQVAAVPSDYPGGITWMRCDGHLGQQGLVWIYDQFLWRWQRPLSQQELATTTTLVAQLEQREQAMRSRLKLPGQALVLLDNVEPDLPITSLLDLCATLNITILLTSRRLPASPRVKVCPLDVLPPESAVLLLAERYETRGGTWDELRDQAPSLAVVTTLGRLPLAIELAAARAARMQKTIEQLAQELNMPNVFEKLRDPIDFTASVRYVLQKSLDLLTPRQRMCFGALGIPEGPDWPLSIILSLLDAMPINKASETSSAEGDLDLLVTLSLVSLSVSERDFGEDKTGMALRVRLHPLLRVLAKEEWQLQIYEKQAMSIAGLLNSILEYIESNKRNFLNLQREEALILGSLRQASQNNLAPKWIILAAETLNDYIFIGGHWHFGLDLHEIQLKSQRLMEDSVGEIRTLNYLGLESHLLGNTKDAKRYLDDALMIVLKEAKYRVEEGITLNNLGLLENALGNKQAAREYYIRALEIRFEIGDRSGSGVTLNNLGAVLKDLGRKEEAESLLRQALEIQRQIGNKYGESTTLNNLGTLASELGQKEEAESLLRQALEIQRQIGDRHGEGTTLNNLGAIADDIGQIEKATKYYEEALAVWREIGDNIGQTTALNNLGAMARKTGRPGADYFFQAAQVFDREGSYRWAYHVQERERAGPMRIPGYDWRERERAGPNVPWDVEWDADI